MLVQNLFIAFALGALGLAQEVERDDIPRQCDAVCSAVVTLANDCDRQHDRDSDELNCICNAPNANTQIPLCEACVAEFDNDGRDNDVNDLLRDCRFSETTYNPSATQVSASATVISGSGSIATATVTETVSQSQGANNNAATTGTGAGAGAATGSANPESTGAAATRGVEAAGVAMGVVGLALGML